MQLRADARLPFARPLVFSAYRDKLTELVPYLPNVRGITVQSRAEDGSVVRMVNIWHGGGEIPASARAFLSESMLSWTDHATWNESEWTCTWRIETHAFTEAVRCEGLNHFRTSGEETLIEIRGDLTIDGRKIRGVPGFLAGSVARAVEEVLTAKIQPNLAQVSDGIRKYLEQLG